MDVCAKLRGIFHEKRVGHAGTLDPMATGVLPVFIGRATRAVQFAESGEKEYLALLQLGVTTDTQDMWGNILEKKPVPPDAWERLNDLLPQFTGEIEQVPPMYSAVKINGKKLYELARKGREVERPARAVNIKSLEILGQQGEDLYTIKARCTKGTYIRTLCHDIGQAMGCGGCMASLRRTMAAGFTLEDAVTLEEIQAAADPAALLLPVDDYFKALPACTIRGKALFRAKNGNPFLWELPDGDYRVYGPEGEFLLLGRCEGGVVATIKSFFEV